MELDKGKISIIIPVFNAEKYLSNVLSDLIVQTYDNLQIIVIDDGSTDKSRCIVKKFLQKDHRILLITSENGGPSKARNLGLQYAVGEFIRFIDADDRIPEDSMEKLVTPLLNDKEIDFTIGNYICTAEKNYYTGEPTKVGKKNRKEFADLFVKHVKSFYYGVPWNKLYKREIIENNKIRFDESLIWCEDFLFNIEYYKHCDYVYIVNTVNGVYKYFVRESGITVRLSDWKQEEIKRIDSMRFEKAMQYFFEFNLDDACRLEWRYSGVYYKLSRLAHRQKSKDLKERYSDFKKIFCERELYEYICIVQNDSNLFVWRFLKYTIEKKKYLLAFCAFVMKEYLAEFVNSNSSFLKKKIKSNVPKFL